MAKYRTKKPDAIEAEQFFPDKTPWPYGVEQYVCKRTENVSGLLSTWHAWRINTPEGLLAVVPGDWVIDGKCICKPGIFEVVYEIIP